MTSGLLKWNACVALCIATAPSAAFAQQGAGSSEPYAGRYADRSVSILSHGDLFGAAPFAAFYFASANPVATLSLGGTVRVVFAHVVIQPSLGVSFTQSSFSTAPTGGSRVPFGVVPGIGVGAAVALGERVAVSPMVRSAFNIFTDGAMLSMVSVELPVAIFIGRNAMIEPYLNVGGLFISVWRGMLIGPSEYFLLGGGYRVGAVF